MYAFIFAYVRYIYIQIVPSFSTSMLQILSESTELLYSMFLMLRYVILHYCTWYVELWGICDGMVTDLHAAWWVVFSDWFVYAVFG